MIELLKKVRDMESSWKIKYPNHKIYLMRDHNWAFSAWEIGRINTEIMSGARLLHVDFHDDYCDPMQEIKTIETEQDALQIGESLEIFDFIKASQQTGTVKDVYTIGDYDMPPDEVYHSYTYNQFENEYRMEFFNSGNQSLILDLDLDYFNLHAYKNIEKNYNDNPFRYSDEFIRKQLEFLKQYEDEWDLITVCISPEHCGGYQTAQEILDIFLEFFNLNNADYIHW